VLVWAAYAGVRTEGKVGAVDRQRLRVERIGAGRERRVVFRTQVEVFPVLSDVGECRDTSWRLWVAPRALTQEGVLTTILVGQGGACLDGRGWRRRAPG
jgi:hypothetical protein